jgi:UDP-N-acetyl-D-glucosamine dehydrogenase
MDPVYLAWKAREFGVHTRFIELADDVDASMPDYVVQKTIDALNGLSEPLKGGGVLVLGVACKKNADDMRESPSVSIMPRLPSRRALVSYSDPFIPVLQAKGEHVLPLSSAPVTQEALTGFDAVLLGTDHDCFDYELILKLSSLLIDTYGRFSVDRGVVRA